MTKLQRREIIRNPRKTEAILLIAAGFSYKYAAKQAQMTYGQVHYWARKAGVKARDYREGKTHFARSFAAQTKKFVTEIPEKKLIEYLKK